ncbi:MAG: LapA family protein [Deltaproteobacteria bacterium]|nr:LapA family protein [Deltaproteobacteria bacterium]
MRYIKVLGLVLIFFFSMLFFVQNTELLTNGMVLKLQIFSYQFTSQEIPFYLLILGGFVVGSVLSLLYFLTDKIRMANQAKLLEKRIQALDKELNSLRTMPLGNEAYKPVENGTPK